MTLKAGFKGQYVLVAGGFRGMGLELAKFLLMDKANVTIIGRTLKNGIRAKEILTEYGSEQQLNIITSDLSSSENLEASRQKVKDWCNGQLNHLVIFLGSGKTPQGFDFPISHWDDVFKANLFTPIAVTQAFYPFMLHGKGNPSIVLTGSIAGVERVRAPMTYSVAKAALIAYANHIAAELVDKGVRVLTVSPGNVFYKGGRWEEIMAKNPDEVTEFLKTSVGMKRLGKAEELAWTYFVNMSPKNSFMTGHNIVSDGLQCNGIY